MPSPPSTSPTIVAETPRLIIRHLAPSDADALAAIISDPEVMRYSGSGARTYADAVKFIERAVTSYATDDGRGTWAMVRKDDGAMIGYCGYFTRENDGVTEHEIGYRLIHSCWGKGFATEAVAAVRDVALDRYGVTRLIALIDPPNLASIRVAEKIGMRHERDLFTHGRRMSVYVLEHHRGPE